MKSSYFCSVIVTLILLTFLAQPVKGPGSDSHHDGRENGTHQQIEAEKRHYCAKYELCYFPFFGRHHCHHYAEEAKKPSRQSADDIYWNRVIGIATVILAAFTIILAVISFFQKRDFKKSSAEQARLFRRANKIARVSMEKQLRAYLSVEMDLRFQSTGKASELVGKLVEEPICQFKVTNNGQTPAYNVTGWCAARIAPRPLPNGIIEFQFPPNPDSAWVKMGVIHKTNLAAKRCTFEPKPIPRENTDSDFKELANGNRAIFYWGRIEYDDAFDNKGWVTEFRFFTLAEKGVVLSEVRAVPSAST